MEYYDPKLGMVDDAVLRTPFHQSGFYPDQKQKAEEITCQIGGTLRATVKNINLTPGDMTAILATLPSNCHIISVDVKQFHHAESPEGEMYNSVQIEYQSDELMNKGSENTIAVRTCVTEFDKANNNSCIISSDLIKEKSSMREAFSRKPIIMESTRYNDLAFEDIKTAASFMRPELMIIAAAKCTENEDDNQYYRFIGITKRGVIKQIRTLADLDADVIAGVYDISNFNLLTVDEVRREFNEARVTIMLLSHAPAGNPDSDKINYIIAKFEELKGLAKQLGYSIKWHPDDSLDMHLYYHGDYHNLILLDKD